VIVKTRDDVIGTKGDARGERWRSLRLLHEEDGMGVTLTDSILEPGFEMDLWQKNHFEACYCLEGSGTVEELETGTIHQVTPGTLYAMNDHDRHRIRAKTRMRIICTFFPALTGHEVHDADGSL
jgi:L-ectoine synthase